MSKTSSTSAWGRPVADIAWPSGKPSLLSRRNPAKGGGCQRPVQLRHGDEQYRHRNVTDQNSIPPNLSVAQDKKPFFPVPLPQKPAVSPPSSTPPTRPIRSFIRTMGSDIQAVQAGKIPQGIEKQLPVLSPPVLPPISSPAPSSPGQDLSQVKLGKIEQNTILVPSAGSKVSINAPGGFPNISLPLPKPNTVNVPASSEAPKLSISSQPAPLLSPSPAPLPSISSPAPPRPLLTAPIPPPTPFPVSKPEAPSPVKDDRGATSLLTAPSAKTRQILNVWRGDFSWIRDPRNMIMVIIILAALGSSIYWFFLRRMSEDGVAVPTPIQTASVTPTPKMSRILSFFPDYYNFLIFPGEGESLTSIEPEILRLAPQFNGKHILLNPRNEFGEDYTWSTFLDRFIIDFPVNLLSVVDEQDFDLVLSQQQEGFDESGKLIDNFGDTRVAVVVRVTDAQQLRDLMLDWEAGGLIAKDFENLFSLPEGDKTSGNIGFSTANYREVAIRYRNFPHPDRSIDYAVVTANDNDDYLVITSSREQIFSIIDALLGF